MIQKSDAIKNYLNAMTKSDLANLYSLNMECQVNVAQDGGERIEGDYKGKGWHGWTDGLQVWKSFRIPWNANKEPEYQDSEMKYDLADHAEGIGLTGWDWKNRLSRWVAYDFDAIAGHKSGLSNEELLVVQNAACEIPWVTVRKSTSGSGLHLYVFLEGVPTKNHSEHAALARAILGLMSAIAGYDFSLKVDACGGNIWVWHRKMKDTDGLTLIKQGDILYEYPRNWPDHIRVVSSRRNKAIPKFVEDAGQSDMERVFNELTGQRNSISLSKEHQRLIDYLQQSRSSWWWDSDHHMLVTHTYVLSQAHGDLNLRGIFSTNSEGTDINTQNCFCFPLRKGGWVVRRFTPGVQESSIWRQDSAGWTYCYYNADPDLGTAAEASEGIEHEKGGFVFSTAEEGLKAAKILGIHIKIPNWALMRSTRLKQHKDGRLIMEIKWEPTDRADDMKGWLPEKGVWRKIFNYKVAGPAESEIGDYDDFLRHVVTETGEDYGWTIKSDGEWRQEPLQHIKLSLKSTGLNQKDLDQLLGASVMKCWRMVNMPFQTEYPGNRRWNRNAAQFRYRPSDDVENLHYPTWEKILNHIGQGLDNAIKENVWAQNNGIVCGADYLKCWIASMLQEPREPLPYLFLYGPQNSGKSILHEALSLLITKGYQRADTALSAKTDFNGELEGAILCVVEETDLHRNRTAYNRIKDWVTSRQLNIRHLYRSAYHVPNTTHWIQCANDAAACPIFTGDTRITMTYVDLLNPEELIPKKAILPKLEKEAPDFMASLIHLELPSSYDRLNLPVICTSEKEIVQRQNLTSLQEFIDEKCTYIPGHMISIADFFEEFIRWIDPSEAHEWTKIRLGRELPPRFPKGRRPSDGHHFVGNISWDSEAEPKDKLTLRNGKLTTFGAK
jgi:hypothetical protein